MVYSSRDQLLSTGGPLAAMLRYRSTFDDLVTSLRPPRRPRTAMRTRPGDAWQKWQSEVGTDGQEEHEVAEALFDLANMFANAEPALEDSPSAPTGPKSKRQRLKLQQQQERQAEQARQKQAEARRAKRAPVAGRGARNSARTAASDSHTYAQPPQQPAPSQQTQQAQQHPQQQQAPMHSHPHLPAQGSLQATAFQLQQQQRDQQALHAAQQQAHFDLAAQLAASPEAAAIAAAWERNPAAAAAALASTGPASFGAAGLLPGLAGMYTQPGGMDTHYGAAHNVAAAAALQHSGWGNPGNIEGFSELSQAQQLAFAEAQLRDTAQRFAAEQAAVQQQAVAQQQQQAALLAAQQQQAQQHHQQAQQHQQHLAGKGGGGPHGINGGHLMNGTGPEGKLGGLGLEARYQRCASHVYIAHFIEHKTKQRAELAAEAAAKQEAGAQQSASEGNGQLGQQHHFNNQQGTPVKQETTSIKQEHHGSTDRGIVGDAKASFSAAGPSPNGHAGGSMNGFAATHHGSSAAMHGSGGNASGAMMSNAFGGAGFGLPTNMSMPMGSSPPNGAFPNQGNIFAPNGPLPLQHIIGSQGGFPSLEAQRQQYAAELGQLAMLTQQGNGGAGAFSQGPNFLAGAQGGQNGFSGSAPQQGQGQQGSQFFAQGQQPGGGGNGGAYNIAGLLGPAALAQIASSAGMQVDGKLLAELQAQQQQQQQQMSGAQAAPEARFQEFAGGLPANLSHDEANRLLIQLQQQQMRQAQLDQQQQQQLQFQRHSQGTQGPPQGSHSQQFGQHPDYQNPTPQQQQLLQQQQQQQQALQQAQAQVQAHQAAQQQQQTTQQQQFKAVHDHWQQQQRLQQQQHQAAHQQQQAQLQQQAPAQPAPIQAPPAEPREVAPAVVMQLPPRPPAQPLPDLSPAATPARSAAARPAANAAAVPLPEAPLPVPVPLPPQRAATQPPAVDAQPHGKDVSPKAQLPVLRAHPTESPSALKAQSPAQERDASVPAASAGKDSSLCAAEVARAPAAPSAAADAAPASAAPPSAARQLPEAESLSGPGGALANGLNTAASGSPRGAPPPDGMPALAVDACAKLAASQPGSAKDGFVASPANHAVSGANGGQTPASFEGAPAAVATSTPIPAGVPDS